MFIINWIVIFLIIIFYSCTQKSHFTETQDYIIQALIKNPSKTEIQFNGLEPNYVGNICNILNDKSILVDKLVKFGFQKIDFGRGNFPPLGPRILIWTMKKEDCECVVTKKYYYTTIQDNFSISESINCTKTTNK